MSAFYANYCKAYEKKICEAIVTIKKENFQTCKIHYELKEKIHKDRNGKVRSKSFHTDRKSVWKIKLKLTGTDSYT